MDDGKGNVSIMERVTDNVSKGAIKELIMALTESTMMPLGSQAPEFCLPEPLTGKNWTLEQLQGIYATLVIFMCNHCPYVKHVIKGINELALDYIPEGVSVIAINSNDIGSHPEDSPEHMVAWAQQEKFPFRYLFDESQSVAHDYGAACTPDFFLFDYELQCVYRGRMDAANPGNDEPVTGQELRDALDAVIAGKDVNEDQKPSLGCNIKWKEEALS